MNGAHFHLIINHASLFLTFSGLLVALYAFGRKIADIWPVAYFLYFVGGLSAGLAYISGGRAEHIVRKLPGIMKSAIEVHESAAKIALVVAILLGALSIIASRIETSTTLRKYGRISTTICALATLAAMGYAASLGGVIHHPEIAQKFQAPADQALRASHQITHHVSDS